MSENLKLQPIQNWLKKNNWFFYDHQLETLNQSINGHDILLIAPTGGGKTLAGFLPSLCDLIISPQKKLHTLYISPLKALSYDVKKNLEIPISEMNLKITVDTRTGDTKNSKIQAVWLRLQGRQGGTSPSGCPL